MIRLVTNVLGVFALRDGKTIEKRLFPRQPAEIARRLSTTKDLLCPEEEEVLSLLLKGKDKEVYVLRPERFRRTDLPLTFKEDKEFTDSGVFARDLGISKKELISLTAEVNELLTAEKLADVDPDQLIVQAVSSIDDLEFLFNRIVERAREWYSLHFPELDHLVSNHETYVSFLSEIGERSGFQIGKLNLEPKFAEKIVAAAKTSLGASLSSEDISAIQAFNAPALKILEAQKGLEDYVGKKMAEIAPNTAILAGPLLGARLIAKAGSLKRLAILPAGTIQILGAEDAFFRFLKTKKNPPKHGLIFALPEIRNAPKHLRGKISRTFAAKLAIAAKTDLFKGEPSGERLRREFLERVEKLSKKS
ncbi:MAG: C/D box methylation guide ribonucleoprotein complex aNOP56 subunit [Candidatus Altiarchaeota archaeon]